MPAIKYSTIISYLRERGFFGAAEAIEELQQRNSRTASAGETGRKRVLLLLYALGCIELPLRAPLKQSQRDDVKYTDPREFWHVIEELFEGRDTTFRGRFNELLDEGRLVYQDQTGEYELTPLAAEECMTILKDTRFRKYWARIMNKLYGPFEKSKWIREILQKTGNWHPLSKARMIQILEEAKRDGEDN